MFHFGTYVFQSPSIKWPFHFCFKWTSFPGLYVTLRLKSYFDRADGSHVWKRQVVCLYTEKDNEFTKKYPMQFNSILFLYHIITLEETHMVRINHGGNLLIVSATIRPFYCTTEIITSLWLGDCESRSMYSWILHCSANWDHFRVLLCLRFRDESKCETLDMKMCFVCSSFSCKSKSFS